MSDISWQNSFSTFFAEAVKKYQAGHQKASGLLNAGEASTLAKMGCTEQEFFDFVEDFAKYGEPSLETCLEIAAVRRDYFLNEQKGIPSPRRISTADLPAKEAAVAGIGWLPRLLPKAEAKLRGEMPPDLMYCCGGDRRFFREHGIQPAEFLRQVWAARGDQDQVVAWVQKMSPQ